MDEKLLEVLTQIATTLKEMHSVLEELRDLQCF